jgi:sarcosine oxidase subunit beta
MPFNNTYDVIIIGAGSIGTPTAFFLSQAGLKVLILDMYASVGQGSNKTAIGGIRATHSEPAKISLCKRSIEIFSSWEAEYHDDVEWRKGGYAFVAYRPKEEAALKQLLVTQRKLDLNIDWLDKNEMLTVIHDINPKNLLGGTYAPDDGHASPLLTNHSFYKHARLNGAIFHFREKVTGILFKRNSIQGIVTNQNAYYAPIVINAAGAWASDIGNLAGIVIPIKPDSHEAGITEPVSQFLNPMVVDIRPTPGSSNFYFYQHATGQIVFCITPSPRNWGFNTHETSEFLPMVARRLIELMPRLGNIRVRRTWRGLYPMTPDGSPYVGTVDELDGFLLAVGMCGQGFMLGPGTAELLTRLILNTLSPEDKQILSTLSLNRKTISQEMLK